MLPENRFPALAVLALLVLRPVAATAGVDAPLPVSPGAADRYLAIDAACPTFSWTAAAAATGYELRVFAANEETGRLDDEHAVLAAVIPGSATSWTPAMAECLTARGQYAWTVRAAGSRSEWSAPRLFTVDPTLRLADLERALRGVLDAMIDEGRLDRAQAAAIAGGVGAAQPDTAPVGSDVAPGASFDESTAALQRTEDERAASRRAAESADPGAEGVGPPSDEAVGPEELGGAAAALGDDLHLENAGVDKILLDALDSSGTGADFRMRHNNGDLTVELDSDLGDFGASLRFFALDEDGVGTVDAIRLDAEGVDNEGGGAIRLFGQNSTGTLNPLTVEIRSTEGLDDGGSLRLFKMDGSVGIDLDAELGGPGGDARITTGELSITGGSDLSEQFSVLGGMPEPGTVLAIAASGGGELRVTDAAYDPMVLGVVSGAGGLKPGMMMGQAGSAADGEVAVALAGRVYVRADTTAGPIRPGDLLTSSAVAGHAMRVADPDRAHGAVLGKALTRLDEGQGLVLVLVTLQ